MNTTGLGSMPSSSMSIPPDPDPARSVANITTIIEKSEEVALAGGEIEEEDNIAEVKDIFPLKLKQQIVPTPSAAKRKHSSTSSVEKPGTFQHGRSHTS